MACARRVAAPRTSAGPWPSRGRSASAMASRTSRAGIMDVGCRARSGRIARRRDAPRDAPKAVAAQVCLVAQQRLADLVLHRREVGAVVGGSRHRAVRAQRRRLRSLLNGPHRGAPVGARMLGPAVCDARALNHVDLARRFGSTCDDPRPAPPSSDVAHLHLCCRRLPSPAPTARPAPRRWALRFRAGRGVCFAVGVASRRTSRRPACSPHPVGHASHLLGGARLHPLPRRDRRPSPVAEPALPRRVPVSGRVTLAGP